jgi:hypothetical protein
MKRDIGEELVNQEHVSQEHVSMLLRSLPSRVPPTGLTTSLRVIASRERQRLVESRSLGRVFAAWLDRTQFTLRDMLRPLMLPAAGGVFSAMVLFSMWVVPTYPLRAKMAVDIPTQLTTGVQVQRSVTAALSDSVLVDVDVDDQGHLLGYQIVSGADVVADPLMRRRMETALWFTTFSPATAFGRPMAGKTRVLLLPAPEIYYVKG